jgi:hypothetical protein
VRPLKGRKRLWACEPRPRRAPWNFLPGNALPRKCLPSPPCACEPGRNPRKLWELGPPVPGCPDRRPNDLREPPRADGPRLGPRAFQPPMLRRPCCLENRLAPKRLPGGPPLPGCAKAGSTANARAANPTTIPPRNFMRCVLRWNKKNPNSATLRGVGE